MEKEGMASVWLGNAESPDALKEFLKVSYTQSGDGRPSAFGLAFGIDEYDKDFTEWTFHKPPLRSVTDLLKPHSYSGQIAPQIVEKVG